MPRRMSRWLETQRGKLRASVPAFQVRERALYDGFRRAFLLLADRGSAVGDYLEFGVSGGVSLNCMYRASEDAGLGEMRLFGFDSFEGLPEEASSTSGGVWKPGQFRSELSATQAWLTAQGIDWSRTVLIPGWFDETLVPSLRESQRIQHASVIMIDCDLYSSAKMALDFVEPLIRDHTVVFFDEWSLARLDEKNLGEKRAFDEFIAERPEFAVEEVPSYSNESRAVVVSRK